MRIIVDTNLWISVLIKRRLHKLLDGLSDGDIRLVVCDELIEEIIRVFRRPKFRHCYSEEQLCVLRLFLEENTERYIINGAVMGCRDPKDDFLLELAAVSSADFLVTGDEDLLEIMDIGECRIISPTDFDIILSRMDAPKIFHDIDCSMLYKRGISFDQK